MAFWDFHSDLLSTKTWYAGRLDPAPTMEDVLRIEAEVAASLDNGVLARPPQGSYTPLTPSGEHNHWR